MKKLKKFLAGVVTLAMAMSMMTMTAFAENTYSNDQGLTISTIDKTQSGSLTIHKYSGEEQNDEAHKGTGAASDVSKVPDDAELLGDVEFSVYEVMDMDEMLNYYSGAEEIEPLGNALSYVDAPVAPAKEYTLKSAYSSLELAAKGKTVDGDIKFDLPLGIYLVIESDVPDAVTRSVAPFLVSIPMTTVEGDKWLYDVEVFPKNKTGYGDVELQKYFIVGGNKTGDSGLPGVTFKLYKYTGTAPEDNRALTTVELNSNNWKEIYSAPGTNGDNDGDSYSEALVTDANGKITIKGLTSGRYYFIEDSYSPELQKLGYILDKKTKYQFIVNGDQVTFPDNSYVINNVITAYNDKPDVEKKVEDRVTSGWVDETDYSFGDTIPYKVTVKVPANIADLQEFILTDTPVGLKDDVGSIVIKGGGATLVKDTDYTVSASGDGFVVTFTTTTDSVKATAGKEIELTYNATLTADAAVTTPENPNTVKLEYSSEILPEGTPGTPTKKEIHDGAIVYSFAIRVDKVNDSGDALSGVKFDLYREAKSTDTGAAKGDTFEGAGLDASKYYVQVASGLTTAEGTGTVTQTGLERGTYWLVETKTVGGYNLLKGPVEVKLEYMYETHWTELTEYDASGKLQKQVYSSYTIYKNADKNEDEVITDVGDLKAGTLVETVVNKEGFNLPRTGGMGTFVFTFVGVAMMAAAVILFFTSKKKEAK